MGIHADSASFIIEQIKQDVFIFDLDNNSVTSPVQLADYPEPEISTLMTDLKRFLNSDIISLDNPNHNPFLSGNKTKALVYSEVNEYIQCAFLKFFTTLFKDYRQFLMYVRVFENPVAIFDSATFIELRTQNKVLFYLFCEISKNFLGIFRSFYSFASFQ